MDLSLCLDQTHVLITGGSGFIGSATVSAFLSAGCLVTSLDLRAPMTNTSDKNLQHFTCDIGSEESLTEAFASAAKTFGPISCCVALAGLDLSFLEHHESLVDMSVEQWRKTMRVNVEGTFLTARTWLRHLQDLKTTNEKTEMRNVGLVIVGSESGIFGVKGNADYSAGKSAVQGGLLLSLVDDVARIWPGARVNAVAPGAVDTVQFRKECNEDPELFWLEAQAT
ncbi:short-chain dehydrogenase reductase sdr [Phlyctema vagabunda]|uniref:Short-chain dehydrogenase reductase sdr n=1 Tax=Phlyctema vagabunda TaxID=108571 RepID=A0ABR4PDL3_9HELO